MTSYVIYESPTTLTQLGGKQRSAPIPADDAKARGVLESAGWKVVEEYEAEETFAPVTALNLPRITQQVAALNREGEAAALAFEPTELTVTPEDDDAPVSWTDRLTAAQVDALNAAGYGTEDALNAATDAQLREVDGIGASTVRNIRKALKQP